MARVMAYTVVHEHELPTHDVQHITYNIQKLIGFHKQRIVPLIALLLSQYCTVKIITISSTGSIDRYSSEQKS